MVVEVPDDAVLMAENSSIAEVLEDWGLCKPAADPVLEIQGLIIALMHEKSLGSSSRWSGYLHWFPPTIDHLPMSWTEEELTELRGTAALDKMEGVVQQPADAPTRVKELWHEVALPFIRENPDLLIPGSVPTSTKKKGGNLRGSTNQSKAVHAEEEGYRLYMWATGIVSSYSFVLGDDKFQVRSMCRILP